MTVAPLQPSACVRKLVDAHFRGDIDPEGERCMRAHLSACQGCERYYERRLLLEKVDPSGLGPEVRLARGLGLRPQRTAAARSAPAATLPRFAAVAALLVGVVIATNATKATNATRATPIDDDFAARGAVTPERAEIVAYRTNPTERLERYSRIRANDEIAFAYTNPRGFHRLLVYGVDEHGHVYWYHPAWVLPADDPHAIPIAAGPELHELPAAIRHALDGHELALHALFTNDDVSVRRVESLLAKSGGPSATAAIEDSPEYVLPLVVEH